MSLIPDMEMILPQTSGGGNVPAFLAKLWKMLNNPDIAHLICWSEEGSSFLIKNQSQFSSSMLPYYYKHSNMASFVRQLNMYDFHKVMNVDAGGLKGERDEVEFAHPHFIRGQEHLLEHIKRKLSVATRGSGQQCLPSVENEKVNEVLSEVGLLKTRQEDLDGKLSMMRNENSELWQEVGDLRQKHFKQQRVVNKLIQFLGTMVQPQIGNNSLKRKLRPSLSMLQLAIEEEYTSAKEPKIEYPAEDPISQDVLNKETESQSFNIVHSSKKDQNPFIMPTTTNHPNQGSYIVPENNQENKTETLDISMPTKRPVLQRQMTKEDVDLDVSNMQYELDSLKDILAGQITLDTNMVSSLFDASVENLPSFNSQDVDLFPQEDGSQIFPQAREVTYQPAQLTMTDKSAIEISNYGKMNPEPELNTPLIQDEFQDPLKHLLKY